MMSPLVGLSDHLTSPLRIHGTGIFIYMKTIKKSTKCDGKPWKSKTF